MLKAQVTNVFTGKVNSVTIGVKYVESISDRWSNLHKDSQF